MSKKAKEENKEKVLEEKQNVEEKKEEKVEVKETDAKKKASKKKDKIEKKDKEGYFKLLKEQMKLVIWPTGKEIFKYTFSTILFILLFVLFFQLIDVISSFVKGLF